MLGLMVAKLPVLGPAILVRICGWRWFFTGGSTGHVGWTERGPLDEGLSLGASLGASPGAELGASLGTELGD